MHMWKQLTPHFAYCLPLKRCFMLLANHLCNCFFNPAPSQSHFCWFYVDILPLAIFCTCLQHVQSSLRWRPSINSSNLGCLQQLVECFTASSNWSGKWVRQCLIFSFLHRDYSAVRPRQMNNGIVHCTTVDVCQRLKSLQLLIDWLLWRQKTDIDLQREGFLKRWMISPRKKRYCTFYPDRRSYVE